MMKTINRIMNSYIQFFKIKNLNVQIVLTDDMYTCQKKYGLIKKTRSLDEAAAPKTGSMLLPVQVSKHMDEPFTLIFKGLI